MFKIFSDIQNRVYLVKYAKVCKIHFCISALYVLYETNLYRITDFEYAYLNLSSLKNMQVCKVPTLIIIKITKKLE